MTNLRKLVWLLRARSFRVIVKLLQRWLWSDVTAYGLERSAAAPIPARKPRTAVTIRPIRPDEESAFTRTPGATPEDTLVRVNARHLLATGLKTCYVAVTDEGAPCYMQYLVLPDENDRLENAFGGLIPALGEGEALLEFAFTVERYRSAGIMPMAVRELGLEARRMGATRLVTYIPEWNPHVLRFFRRIGFEPFVIRRERYRLLRRRIWLVQLPEAGADV
jgi:GNAT superfamily N-acetyltransferase